MAVFNFGSINIDHVYRVERFVQPGETLSSLSLDTVLGGKGANQSVALARSGAPVAHLGRVSEGDAWAKQAMVDFGVHVDGIELIDAPSGHAIIQVDANGENAIVLHGGANQSFTQEVLQGLLSSANAGDWLLVQNECNALQHAFDIAHQKQMNIAFNPAPMNRSVAALPLHLCDLLILNEVEAVQLANATHNDASPFSENAENDVALHTHLQTQYPDSAIVLTLGSKGAILMHQGQTHRVGAPSVKVVDSTGAGDTFVGYYLSGLIDNLAHETCLQRACVAGALAVTVAGATPGIPVRSEVDEAVDAMLKGKPSGS